jgi:FtsZ-binding cell division protein ZapB
VELEPKNCKLKATVTESTEEYEVLQLGNMSLLAERNNFQDRCEHLEAGLAKVHSDSSASIASLEAKIKSAKAHP